MADEARMDSGLERPYGSTASGPPGVAQEAAGMARERAGSMWNDAKETTRTKLNEQKDVAAQGIGDVAQALREAARRHEGDGVSRLTSSAADGLERVSSALRHKDVNSMLRDMDRFARDQPVAFFGLAVAAGFLAVRLLRDSSH
jgi:hypothetical protein